MKKSLMYVGEAAEITLKLLDKKGTVNIGGKSQSVYEFVKKSNPNVGKVYLSDINDVNMAKDCSMNTSKMKELLNDTIV
jgi:dTDP-4-dehydrorhamnose reductase